MPDVGEQLRRRIQKLIEAKVDAALAGQETRRERLGRPRALARQAGSSVDPKTSAGLFGSAVSRRGREVGQGSTSRGLQELLDEEMLRRAMRRRFFVGLP